MPKHTFKKDQEYSWKKIPSNTVKQKDMVDSSENTKTVDFWKDLSG